MYVGKLISEGMDVAKGFLVFGFGVLNLDIDSIDTMGGLDACWKKLLCEWMDVAK